MVIPRRIHTLIVALALCAAVVVPFGSVAHAYDLFFLPNTEFERNLDGWMYVVELNSQADISPGTVVWSEEYGGSAHMTASGSPGWIGLVSTICTALYPGDMVICRLTRTEGFNDASYVSLVLGSYGYVEWSQGTNDNEVGAGTHDLELLVDRIWLPGTRIQVTLPVQSGDAEAWIHYVHIESAEVDGDRYRGASPDEGGRAELPLSALLSPLFPNPTNAGTRIMFTLPARATPVLRLYDVNGRVVRTFLAEQLESGEHSVWWNGKNDSGNAVSSGAYFFQLDVNGQQFARKSVMLR